jgi:flagella synthesis protein FlgN
LIDNNTLLAHLQAETLAIRQFNDLLKAEQKALVDSHVEALTAHTQAKLGQVEALNRLAAVRMTQLATLGFSADEQGMEQWLTMAGGQARKAWGDLLALAKEANATNQLNGKLIQQRMQQHQQALTALMAAANQVKLYGADGQPQGAFASSGASRGIIGTA